MFQRKTTGIPRSSGDRRYPRGVRKLRITQAATVLGLIASLVNPADADVRSSGTTVNSRLIELTTTSQTIQGKVVAINSEHACLFDRFGRMERIPTEQLKSFRVISERFQPATAAELREQLKAEFPRQYEIAVGPQYMVCASLGRAENYKSIFQDVYRSVERHYRVHGFRTTTPENTLVAVVFGTQQEFTDFCRRDQVPWSPGLKGYYSLRSNRIIMFDPPELRDVRTSAIDRGPVPVTTNPEATTYGENSAVAMSTASTIVHEATHQIGFNIGIHSRLSTNPTWVIEGLATVLEAPGVRNTGLQAVQKSQLNSERFDWFQNQYSQRRQSGDLASLIAADDMFGRKSLDAYSHAWALTYFLTENPARAQQFATFLQRISQRTPGSNYSASERLQDFQAVFGDISQLEVELSRFMDRLPRTATGK